MGRKKVVPVDNSDDRRANVVPVTIVDIDGKRKGYMCSNCKVAWYEKDLYTSECPLCSCTFDEVLTGKPVKILYSRRYRANKKAEEKALIKEEEKKEKEIAKAKEKKIKERAKAKEKAKKKKEVK